MIDVQVDEDARIRLSTRFGEFEADPRNLVWFPAGLPGFEACRWFAVLSSPEAAPLQCLHAVDGTAASFLAVDPRLVLPEYRCTPGEAEAERLRATDPSRLLWLAILSLDPQGRAFANLRAPVVINPETMTGVQLMPHDTCYQLRHPVAIR